MIGTPILSLWRRVFRQNPDFSSKSQKKEKNEPLRGAQMAEISANPKISGLCFKSYDQKKFHVSATHTRGEI